jgi:hypothetical protein
LTGDFNHFEYKLCQTKPNLEMPKMNVTIVTATTTNDKLPTMNCSKQSQTNPIYRVPAMLHNQNKANQSQFLSRLSRGSTAEGHVVSENKKGLRAKGRRDPNSERNLYGPQKNFSLAQRKRGHSRCRLDAICRYPPGGITGSGNDTKNHWVVKPGIIKDRFASPPFIRPTPN